MVVYARVRVSEKMCVIMAQPITSQKIILTLKEFIGIWVNQILYHYSIYRNETFDLMKSFGHHVYINRNPNLKSYVNQLVEDFLGLLMGHKSGSSKVNQLLVVIYDESNNRTVSRYVLQFRDLLLTMNKTTGKIADTIDDKSAVINLPGITWEEIQTQFTSVLHFHIQELVHTCHQDDSSQENSLFFKIIIEVDDSIKLENSSWVRQQCVQEAIKPTVKPVGDVSLTILNFDTYNEYY